MRCYCTVFFFFNDTATTEIYTLSLHDALPISVGLRLGDLLVHEHHHVLRVAGHALAPGRLVGRRGLPVPRVRPLRPDRDRKSTRLNSSHANISYAVFCLKKKKTT